MTQASAPPSTATQPVLFEELESANGRRIGVATLASEKTLHAISLEMVNLLTPQLRKWQADPEVAMIRARGGAAVSRALRDAFAALTPRERSLLRLQFCDGLGIDHVGIRPDKMPSVRGAGPLRGRACSQRKIELGKIRCHREPEILEIVAGLMGENRLQGLSAQRPSARCGQVYDALSEGAPGAPLERRTGR